MFATRFPLTKKQSQRLKDLKRRELRLSLETAWLSKCIKASVDELFDERELWLRPVDSVIAPTEFEVVRAAPSFMRYGEYAFSHRFVHLGGYDLHNEDDVRIFESRWQHG